jgi:hypothetical protein
MFYVLLRQVRVAMCHVAKAKPMTFASCCFRDPFYIPNTKRIFFYFTFHVAFDLLSRSVKNRPSGTIYSRFAIWQAMIGTSVIEDDTSPFLKKRPSPHPRALHDTVTYERHENRLIFIKSASWALSLCHRRWLEDPVLLFRSS